MCRFARRTSGRRCGCELAGKHVAWLSASLAAHLAAYCYQFEHFNELRFEKVELCLRNLAARGLSSEVASRQESCQPRGGSRALQARVRQQNVGSQKWRSPQVQMFFLLQEYRFLSLRSNMHVQMRREFSMLVFSDSLDASLREKKFRLHDF